MGFAKMAGEVVYVISLLLTQFSATGQRSAFYPPSSQSPKRYAT